MPWGHWTCNWLEKCLRHVAASVSECCLCHGADQHMLLVAEVCVHRMFSVCVCARLNVCVCLVGVLQVDDYTSPPWLTTRFLLWCNRRSNTLRWYTHCKNVWQLMTDDFTHHLSRFFFFNFIFISILQSQSGKLGNVVPVSATGQTQPACVLLRGSRSCYYST